MANLKRKSFSNQIVSAKCLLEARNTARFNNEDSNLTHSHELAKKRAMYLRNFESYLINNNKEGKMNCFFSDYNFFYSFFINRITKLAKTSSIDYLSGWNSMLLGLLQKNITISDDALKCIEDIRILVKELPVDDFRKGRAFKNSKDIINKMFDIRFESGIIAQVQSETGFRISEAYRFIRDINRYLIKNEICGLIGKSKHMYDNKKISQDLILKLKGLQNIPTRHTYSKHLKLATGDNDSIPHDFRITYVKLRFNELINEGYLRHEALIIVSKEVNHHRASITEYYLARA